jgi:hypothetical protein
VIAITMPASVTMQIKTCITIQKRGSCTYSIMACRKAIATACTRVSASSF